VNSENKKYDITQSNEVTETAAVEQSDIASEIDRSPTRLAKIGKTGLEVATLASITTATYAAMRSGSLDSLHVPVIESGDDFGQLLVATWLGGVGLSTARFASKRLRKDHKK